MVEMMNDEIPWDLVYGADDEADEELEDVDELKKFKKESKREKEKAIASYIG